MSTTGGASESTVYSAETARRPSEAATSSTHSQAQPRRFDVPQGHLLRNFAFPILKTCGNQRVLRCMSVNGKGEAIGGGAACRTSSEAVGGGICVPEGSGDDDGGIEEVREKLLVHLRKAADRMKLVVPPPMPPPPKGGETQTEPEREAEAEPSLSAAARPSKLRTRRRRSRAPAVSELQAIASRPEAAEKRAVRLRSGCTEPKERTKFSITLTREEIEEDIYAVTGHRARRRPRKRPRLVQKQLDLLFPGSWLSEITLDTYKVPD
ncbi:unnamed protein product [Musa acuminata subsp. burmannicoides]